jgi:peptide-methionine (S)-S-oxide reductase
MQTIPAVSQDVATLAGGCYWCLEAPLQHLAGVHGVISGFMGGHVPNPRYEQVCNGGTGHAEVVQVHFDPERISYRMLLEVFFTLHDPTTLNRQGHDIGTQYRSALFYHSDQQRLEAEQCIARLTAEQAWRAPIVTQVVPAMTFYPAEESHQHYFERNPSQPYCLAVVAPKLARLRAEFPGRLKSAG